MRHSHGQQRVSCPRLSRPQQQSRRLNNIINPTHQAIQLNQLPSHLAMALNSNDPNLDKIDPELKEFIVNEQIKTQIQAQIRKLNIVCFAQCVEKPGSKLESKQENCIKNCVGRYLEANGFIANRFGRRSNVPSDTLA